MNPSLTAKVRLHARSVHIDRSSAGDASKACQAGRSSGSGGRITRGQTPVAYHEAFAATCSESDCQGRSESTSVAAGKLHQFEERREWWFGFWQGEREGELPVCGELLISPESAIRHTQVQYLNNILEQDHRAIKRRVKAKPELLPKVVDQVRG